MRSKWSVFLQQKRKRNILIISILTLALVLFAFSHFLTYNENRPGYVLNDPILNALTPSDLSGITCFLTYSFACVGLIIAFRDPQLFINLIQAFLILTLVRISTLYLLPLEPPKGIVILDDNFLRFFFYSGRDNLKDLFFSGHTAGIFLLAFIFNTKRLKWIFSSAAILIGFLLMKQHVHYSIDVFLAPVFAWISVFLQKNICLSE